MIDCKAKTVGFNPAEEEKFTFFGDKRGNQKMFISAMQARKWITDGCTGFLANVLDTTKKGEAELKDVPVVNEFVSIFPEDLSGLPPDREEMFEIEVLLGTTPISKGTMLKGACGVGRAASSTPRFSRQNFYST